MDLMLKKRFTVAKLRCQLRWFNPDLEKWLHRIKLPALVPDEQVRRGCW